MSDNPVDYALSPKSYETPIKLTLDSSGGHRARRRGRILANCLKSKIPVVMCMPGLLGCAGIALWFAAASIATLSPETLLAVQAAEHRIA